MKFFRKRKKTNSREPEEHTFQWKFSEDPPGIELYLPENTGQRKKLTDWPSFEKDIGRSAAIASLRQLEWEDPKQVRQLGTGDGYYLSNETVANLNEVWAQGLNLPPVIPHVFKITIKDTITSSNFRIGFSLRNTQEDRDMQFERKGALLNTLAHGDFRLPAPFYQMAEKIKEIKDLDQNNSQNYDERLRLISELQSLISDASEEKEVRFKNSRTLHNIELVYATAFALDVNKKPPKEGQEDYEINPILFGRSVSDGVSLDGRVLDQDDQLMDNEDSKNFIGQFISGKKTKRTYVLEGDRYVVIDKSLQPALELVHRINRGSPTGRKAFIQNPRGKLREHYLAAGFFTSNADGEDENTEREEEQLLEKLFIETKQFSERVIGFGFWKRPVLPWLNIPPQTWLPDDYHFWIDDQLLVIPRDRIEEAVKIVEDALEAGKEQIRMFDQDIKPSRDLLKSLKALAPARPDKDDERKPKGNGIKTKGSDGHDTPPPPYVPLTKENFEALDYISRFKDKGRVRLTKNYVLKQNFELKSHQKEGLDWLEQVYSSGLPGALLADDMGLGKTLQILAFLQKLRATTTKPYLIVAPIGLLKNWYAEHDKYLDGDGIGKVLRAYSHHLKEVRVEAGNELGGEEALDSKRMSEDYSWILTSYETLRNYQMTFAKIQFSCIVFDEIQTVKNPRSLNCHAAKILKSGFFIGLSGTPIENSLSDLWTIMDILLPGLLKKDLRSFMKSYPSGDMESLKRLYALLTKSQKEKPPFVLRRLKKEVFTQGNFPPKTIYPIKETTREMPKHQADIYTIARERHERERPNMLETLWTFRSISLHPSSLPQEDVNDHSEYISRSARLIKAMEILDKINSKEEKALIFLQSRRMQPVLASIIKARYGMEREPLIIHGNVKGDVRLKMVDRFQAGEGFDVLIISPRAGGVGINLTAANHVLHLERWWNPAVEDQCTGRAYRIGQVKEVFVYLFLARHPLYKSISFDFVLDGLLKKKRALAESVFAPMDIGASELANVFGFDANVGDISPEEIAQKDPLLFEDWVCQRIQRDNQDLEVNPTLASHDKGADIIVKNHDYSRGIIIQCKHKSSLKGKASDNAIKDLIRARTKYLHKIDDIHKHLFAITNAQTFSKKACALARQEQITLIDGSELLNIGKIVKDTFTQ